MQIPFGPYRPDVAETNPAMSRNVRNVSVRKDSQGVSYHPRKSHQVVSIATALPSAPRGTISVVTRAGEFQGYFCTATKLYKLTSTYGFTEIGTGYSLPGSVQWGACQYGIKALFTNSVDGILVWDIESGGSVTALSGAPKARTLFVAFECVFAADCDGDNRILKNSAPGDYTNWTNKGATTQEFADGEALMGGGSLNDGVAAVIQRGAVSLLSVTGDRAIYRKDKIADGVGAVNPECIVQTPGALYFIDASGPYVVTAQGVQPIGEDKVSRTFVASVGDISTIEGAYDAERRQVVWRKSATELLVYDLATGEFIPVDESTSAIIKMSSPALTLEDLDAFGSIDTLPYSLDSAAWKSGRPRLAALNSGYVFGFFDGAALAATIDTAALTNGKTMLAQWASPVTDAANVTLSLGVRDRLSDSEVWKDPASMAASGRVPLRGRGKVLTLRAQIAAGETWSYLRGIDDFVMSTGGPK